MNGGWSDWMPGRCSATCGRGFIWSTRKCNNPKPANGGSYCIGTDRYVRYCHAGCCPGTN